MPAIASTVGDWRSLIGRHLIHLRRMPDKVVSATVLPMIFVLVFGLLFGSVISLPSGNYREFIMAGIFTQVMITAVPNTAIGLIGDLKGGLVDRFRSLPMAPSAVIVGRTVADTILRAGTCVAISVVGLVIGWRTHTGVLEVLVGYATLLLFGFTMAWLGALLGLTVKSPEAAASTPSVLLMPMMFLSSAYIPLSGLPSWLCTIAEWNPISAVVNAVRLLWGNPNPTRGFTTEHAIPLALAWLLAILAVVVPVTIRRYHCP